MNVWINCLSATPQLLKVLDPQPVDIFSTIENRKVGRVLRYEVRNDVDLWAYCSIDDTAKHFERAAGILSQAPQAGVSAAPAPKLVAVLATNLSREELQRLGTP